MSRGFIVGKGGGMNKGAVKKGTIVVKYPEGSVCTVTGNGKTYTALDTSGAAAFVVEPGSYAVTATPAGGGTPASQGVTVTAGGWVEVELSFELVLYRNGDENESVTGGWIAEARNVSSSGGGGQMPTVTKYDDHVVIQSASSYNGSVYRTQNKIDLTDYSTLVFKGSTVLRTTATDYLRFCVWSDIGTYWTDNIVASLIDPSVTNGELTLDVSAVSGSVFIGWGMYSPGFSVDMYDLVAKP